MNCWRISENMSLTGPMTSCSRGPMPSSAVSLNVVSVFDRSNPKTVDWAATLSRITCPTLLIVSDPELGGIVTAEDAASLKALVPQAEVVHIPEAGHSIRRDQFQPYVDAVRVVSRYPCSHHSLNAKARPL